MFQPCLIWSCETESISYWACAHFYRQHQAGSSWSLAEKPPLQWGACIITGNTETSISHSNGKIHSSSTLTGRKYTENGESAEFQLSEKGRDEYFWWQLRKPGKVIIRHDWRFLKRLYSRLAASSQGIDKAHTQGGPYIRTEWSLDAISDLIDS